MNLSASPELDMRNTQLSKLELKRNMKMKKKLHFLQLTVKCNSVRQKCNP